MREGRAGVQDEGIQLVALALATRRWTARDGRWLDLCAGPGGKAALLGALAAQRARRLTAVELPPHRAGLVRPGRSRAAREVVPGRRRRRPDPAWRPGALRPGAGRRPPCTGLGALRRRPRPAGAATRRTSPALTPLQRDAAWHRAGRGPAGRRRRVRDLLAAPGRDPGGGGRRAAAASDVERLDARPLLARRARPRRRARTCSCGRTGTAPTRCSSPCCARTWELHGLTP